MSIQAYQQAAQRAESPREIEYRAFAMATHGLVQARGRRTEEFAKFVEALDKNRRLWSFLAAECADPGNALPGALRAQIISLAIFVEKQTRSVQSGEGDIDALIDINKSIMEGLAVNPASRAAR